MKCKRYLSKANMWEKETFGYASRNFTKKKKKRVKEKGKREEEEGKRKEKAKKILEKLNLK
jgi:hypothetical protein